MTKQQEQNNQTTNERAAGQTGLSGEGSKDEIEAGQKEDREDEDQHGRALIAELLRKMRTKLAKGDGSGSLADFIRLVQLDREMAEEEPAREIVVTWIDGGTESVIGK
jgi:hypothetical protein